MLDSGIEHTKTYTETHLLVLTETPSDKLKGLVAIASEEIRDQVNSARFELDKTFAKLAYQGSASCEGVVEEYLMRHYENIDQGSPIYTMLSPMRMHYLTRPELYVFKEGTISLGTARSIVIPLLITGNIKASIIDSNDKYHDFTWEQSVPTYFSQNLRIKFEGSGRVVCITMLVKHRTRPFK